MVFASYYDDAYEINLISTELNRRKSSPKFIRWCRNPVLMFFICEDYQANWKGYLGALMCVRYSRPIINPFVSQSPQSKKKASGTRNNVRLFRSKLELSVWWIIATIQLALPERKFYHWTNVPDQIIVPSIEVFELRLMNRPLSHPD